MCGVRPPYRSGSVLCHSLLSSVWCRIGDWKLTCAAIALVVGIGAALYLLSPVLIPLGNINLLIFFVGLVAVMVFSAVPIAFAFGLATFAYITLTTTTPATVMVGRMDEGMSHLILLSVPLFVFLGAVDRDDRHGSCDGRIF